MKLSITNFKRSGFRILSLSFLFSSTLFVSCDPSFDELEFELPESNSLEDETPPTSFFTFVNDDEVWYRAVFANGSSNASSYEWDFGDGSDVLTIDTPSILDEDSIELTGVYEFPIVDEETTYTVTLTVTDNHGLESVYTDDVTITPDPDFVLPVSYDAYTLVNTGDDTDPVSVLEFSSYQIEKSLFPSNSIDLDLGTTWTSEDADGDGEYVIYDLGSTVDLTLLRISFTDKSPEAYGYQILTSSTGTDAADFTTTVPVSGGADDVEYTVADGFLLDFEIDATSARYVKLVVYGRFDATTLVSSSPWTNVSEIKFYTDNEDFVE